MKRTRGAWFGVVAMAFLAGACANGGGILDGTPRDVARPEIGSLTPETGIVGLEVALRGTGFGIEETTGVVRFGSHPATVLSWADEEIVVEVPDVLPGPVDVTVTAGGQDSGATPFGVVLPRVAYVNDDVFAPAENSIAAFAVDAEGLLTTIGGPWKTGGVGSSFGGDASSVKLHAPTRRLLASNDGSLAVFDVDGRTGALSAVPGSPFSTSGIASYGIAVTADGKFVFAANAGNASPGDATIAAFTMNEASGALAPVPGSPFPSGSSDPADGTLLLALGKGDRFLYSLNQKGRLAAFALHVDGALSPISGSPWSIAPSASSYAMALSPSQDRLYVADAAADLLHAFSLDESTGAPSAISGSPFPAADPGGLTFSPDGARLYVTSWSSPMLQALDVSETGALTPVSGSPFDLGLTGLSSTASSADGALLVVLDEFGMQVGAFAPGAGAPTSVSPVVPTGETESHRPSGLVLSF